MPVRVTTKLLTAAWLCLACVSARAAHTQARLLLAAETARPGDTVLAGVRLQMDPRWHTYWRNPGASGMATTIEWQLPPGVSAGDIQWPVPEKLPDEDLTTYVYKDEVVLLVPLKLAPNLPPGQYDLKAKVSWLECDLQCVPGNASLLATLTVGAQDKPSKDASLIQTWGPKLPQRSDGLSAQAWWEKPATGDTRPLMIEWTAPKASEADLYPDASEQFEVEGPTERVPAEAGKILLRKQVKKFSGDWPERVSGLLIQQAGPERVAYQVSLAVQPSSAIGSSGATRG